RAVRHAYEPGVGEAAAGRVDVPVRATIAEPEAVQTISWRAVSYPTYGSRLPGAALRPPPARALTRVHPDRGRHPGARDRRQHRGIQPRQWHPPRATRFRATEPTGLSPRD